MEILELLPSSFGYVILTYLYSWIMLCYLGIKVGGARKKYDVKVKQNFLVHNYDSAKRMLRYCCRQFIGVCSESKTTRPNEMKRVVVYY